MDSSEAGHILQRAHQSPYPVPLQRRVDYNETTDPVYIGFAVRGYAETDARWFIEKLEYDIDGGYVKSTHSQINAIWANRAGEVYA